MSYIHNELCKLRRRSDEHIELTKISWHLKNIYPLTKSVKDIQPTPPARNDRTLVVFARFVSQNVQIEVDQYIAITAVTVHGEILGDLQWLFRFVAHHSHLIPRMRKDIAECEGSPNPTIGPQSTRLLSSTRQKK
jgi:hypothetical protein